MLFNNIYASLSSPNLAEDDVTERFRRRFRISSRLPSPKRSSSQGSRTYDYEDLLKKKNLVRYSILDLLARESDVIVSNKITLKTEYNGFAIHLLSICFLVIWLTWALIPKSGFNSLGIYYYPDRWWQLAIPSYVLVAMVYIYLGLLLYNVEVKAKSLQDIRNVTDEHAVVSGGIAAPEGYVDLDQQKYLWGVTSGVWDLPVTSVLKVLYGDYEALA